MARFRFHWLDGKTNEGEGEDAADALTRLGYGGGAARALDYYEQVYDHPDFEPEAASPAPTKGEGDG